MNIIKGISQVACAIACAVLLAGASPANADGVTWTYEKIDKTVTEPTDDVLWAGYTCTAASTPEDTLAKSAQYIVCGVKAPKKSGLLIIFSQK